MFQCCLLLGDWYTSCSDTRSLFTRHLSRYAASAAAPYLLGFIHLDEDEESWMWRGRLLNEEPPPWLGILAKSSLVSECVERACVRCRLHVFGINLEFFSPLCTLRLSRNGVRDSLTYCVHLKRDQSSYECWILFLLCRDVLFMCDFAMFQCCLLLGGWYTSCSDTRLLFTQHHGWTIWKPPPSPLPQLSRRALATVFSNEVNTMLMYSGHVSIP